jgi:ligand-binding sensor domain-containing protein
MLIATLNGIWRSSNSGANWSAGSTGLPTTSLNNLLLVDDGSILVSTADAGIWRSSDGGRSWYDRNNGISSPSIGALHQTRDGMLLAGGRGVLYRSTNRGTSWSACRRPPQRSGATALPVSFAETADGVIYTCAAGRVDGVYRSTDRGDTWELASHYPHEGFGVLGLGIDRSGYLYVGTDGHGLWRSVESTGVASMPGDAIERRDVHLEVVVHDRSIEAWYELAESGHVRLTLHDMLGRTVQLLLDAGRPSGRHRLDIDPSLLPSGTSFLHMQTDRFSMVRPVLITR